MAAINGWQVALTRTLGIPTTAENLKFLSAWQQAEGGSAAYNPLNTTQPAPGASAYNSVGVRNFVSPQQGIQATAQTLANGHYNNLLSMLRSGKATAAQLASQPDLKTWGTGSGVLRVLGASPVTAAWGTPKGPGGKAGQGQAGLPPLREANPAALALLAQSSQTAAGAGPDMNGLLQLAMQRQQAGAAQATYGAQGANGGLTGAPTGANVGGIVKTAESQLGTPYQYGGKALLGAHTDCSGLVQAVMAKNGISVPRTTYQQWQVGQPVAPANLKPGDAVFFKGSDPKGNLPGHVGLYIGGGRFIEDPHTGAAVRISNLSTYPGYVGARRYSGGAPAA
jgi:cell wall-associated NlpC family hydrolase